MAIPNGAALTGYKIMKKIRGCKTRQDLDSVDWSLRRHEFTVLM